MGNQTVFILCSSRSDTLSVLFMLTKAAKRYKRSVPTTWCRHLAEIYFSVRLGRRLREHFIQDFETHQNRFYVLGSSAEKGAISTVADWSNTGYMKAVHLAFLIFPSHVRFTRKVGVPPDLMPLFETLRAIHEYTRDRQNAYSANNQKLLLRLADVFWRTWDLGFTAFGGPPVHFQILHKRFVEGHGGLTPWVDEQTV